jgi:GxxExxY protein
MIADGGSRPGAARGGLRGVTGWVAVESEEEGSTAEGAEGAEEEEKRRKRTETRRGRQMRTRGGEPRRFAGMETELTHRVIGAAMDVHRLLGPGLLESAYRVCLVHELARQGLRVASEVPISVSYRGVRIDCGYRLDLMVEERLPVELRSVHSLEPIHTAQLLTYLKLCQKPLGLLINFNVPTLRQGIRRVINTHPSP